MISAGQELGKGVVDSTDSGTLRNLRSDGLELENGRELPHSMVATGQSGGSHCAQGLPKELFWGVMWKLTHLFWQSEKSCPYPARCSYYIHCFHAGHKSSWCKNQSPFPGGGAARLCRSLRDGNSVTVFGSSNYHRHYSWPDPSWLPPGSFPFISSCTTLYLLSQRTLRDSKILLCFCIISLPLRLLWLCTNYPFPLHLPSRVLSNFTTSSVPALPESLCGPEDFSFLSFSFLTFKIYCGIMYII